MLRKAALVLAILIGGAALAFFILFAGCEGSSPIFGSMCGHNIVPSLFVLTLVSWFVLGSFAVLVRSLRDKE